MLLKFSTFILIDPNISEMLRYFLYRIFVDKARQTIYKEINCRKDLDAYLNFRIQFQRFLGSKHLVLEVVVTLRDPQHHLESI